MAMLRRALKNQAATGILELAHDYVFELMQNAAETNYPDNADAVQRTDTNKLCAQEKLRPARMQ